MGATVGLLVEADNKQAQNFQAAMRLARAQDTFQLYTLQSLPNDLSQTPVESWLAMGAKSLAILLGRLNVNHNKRVLGLFVRPEAKAKLKNLYPNKLFSLLDNTPPLTRQLALIKVLSPQIKSVAILHTQEMPVNLNEVNRQAKKMGLTLRTALMNDPLNWSKVSLQVLKESDVVLGINDSAIYNATTIRSILMRLYRASRPLIGPDKGYVRAGAVASTYSGVKETIQSVSQLLGSNETWSEIIPNSNFNVAINTQVARSLNINIVGIKDLSEQVRDVLK
jgi:ABC-type uncharacterized transport system substrate-binding protein